MGETTTLEAPAGERTATRRSAVLVLASGGMDSTACVSFYASRNYDISLLFVDYGQPARAPERTAVRRVQRHYDVPLREVKIAGLAAGPGFVPGRNGLLIACALAACPFEVGTISIGIHSGTRHVDCGSSFVDAAQHLADLYSGGRIQIGAPFVSWDKQQVFSYCKVANVPIGATYSCETGAANGCGTCATCKDLRELHV